MTSKYVRKVERYHKDYRSLKPKDKQYNGKNKEWYTKHYTKTQDWATLTPHKIEVNPGAAPEGQSSCSSSGIRHVTVVENENDVL